MKNLIVANLHEEGSKYNFDSLFTLVKLQIDNSLILGWKQEDIIVISNKEFEYLGVKAMVVDLNNFCFTGSKMFAVKYLFDQGITDIIWAHDCDAIQDYWFDCPDFKDVGITQYSRPKINGGSVFWRPEALDIVNNVVNILIDKKEKREEPVLNRELRQYNGRVTILDHGYNVGCSGFYPRYIRSEKPVKVFHFHPTNSIAWETHVLDRSGCGGRISERLEQLIRKYYPDLATQLSKKGAKRRKQKIKELLKNEKK